MVAARLTNRLIRRPPRSQVARVHQVARPDFMISLGLGPPYRVDDVKQAYLERAKLLHPDKGGSMPQFLRLQDAFERATEYAASREHEVMWAAAQVEDTSYQPQPESRTPPGTSEPYRRGSNTRELVETLDGTIPLAEGGSATAELRHECISRV